MKPLGGHKWKKLMANILVRKSIARLREEAEETEIQALMTHGGVPLKRTLSAWSLVSLGIGCTSQLALALGKFIAADLWRSGGWCWLGKLSEPENH
jgi:hypothetical protein